MPLTENFYVMAAETGTDPLMRWGGGASGRGYPRTEARASVTAA